MNDELQIQENIIVKSEPESLQIKFDSRAILKNPLPIQSVRQNVLLSPLSQ